MTKNEVKKKYGLSTEAFNFYITMEIIKNIGEDSYEVDNKLEEIIIEKSTIYKYHFSDSFVDDIRQFVNSSNLNSKVKVYSKEEIEEYKKKKEKKG